MVVRKIVWILVLFLGATLGTANAQSDARIRIAVPSIDQVEADLKWLIELSPTQDLKKQWKKLKEDVLGAFEEGVDLKKPFELDLVFRKDDLSYEYKIPVESLKAIQTSIEGMGFKFKTLAPDFYSFAEKGKKPFYLKYDKATSYAWISSIEKGLPATLPNAPQTMQTLLAHNKDVIAELKNDAAGMDARRKNFKELRKQFEALIKQLRNEDKNAFELRKLWMTQQLDEAERFLVESDSILGTWLTESTGANPHARGEISITALPGTDLLKSIQLVAAAPSAFANVELHPNPVIVSRTNFPIDPMRQGHFKAIVKAMRPDLEKRIDAGDAQDKAAAKQATNKFLDMVDAGIDQGIIDGFMDAHSVAKDKNVMVGAMRVADGKAFDEILKLLPKIKSEWTVEADKAEHGGVSIHEVGIPQARLESFQRIFPGEKKILIGTSKNAVWTAAGDDALNHLKSAIDQAAKPAPEKADPVVLNYQVQVAKLVTLLDIAQKEMPALNSPTAKEKERLQKEVEKHRKLAKDSMGNCDSLLKGDLRRTGDKIEGYFEMNECVLKYIGATVADTVKTVLE